MLDAGLKGQQAGRLVQRLLEIETYRMMALLGLPPAQRSIPMLNAIESELASLTSAMVEIGKAKVDGVQDTMQEETLLDQITALAARLEQLAVDNNYRFSAAQAYFKLGHSRIDELRERRIEGVPTIAEAGVKGYESGVWFGLAAPAGTPPEVIARLNAAAVAGTKSPDFVKRMTELGYNILGTSAAEMASMNQMEINRWGPIVKASGAKAD